MDALDVLDAVAAAGATLELLGEKIRLEPRSVVPPEARAAIQENKSTLVQLLRPEVRWRFDAMRRQLPTHGPALLLVARDCAWPDELGRCVSCGDWAEPETIKGGSFPTPSRCSPCIAAARWAIELVRKVRARPL